jgi:hypothetical protein
MMTQQHVQRSSSDQVDLKVMEQSIYSYRFYIIKNLHESRKMEGSEFSVL